MAKRKYFCEVKFCSREENINHHVKIVLQNFLEYESILIEDKESFIDSIEKIKEKANYYLKNSNREINIAYVDLNDYVNVFVSDHNYDMLFQFLLHTVKNS